MAETPVHVVGVVVGDRLPEREPRERAEVEQLDQQQAAVVPPHRLEQRSWRACLRRREEFAQPAARRHRHHPEQLLRARTRPRRRPPRPAAGERGPLKAARVRKRHQQLRAWFGLG